MRFDWIRDHVEVFTQLDENLRQAIRVLNLHVPIDNAMLDHQRILQLIGIVDGAGLAIRFWVFGGRAVQDSTRVSIVVVRPISHWVQRNTCSVTPWVSKQ